MAAGFCVIGGGGDRAMVNKLFGMICVAWKSMDICGIYTVLLMARVQ